MGEPSQILDKAVVFQLVLIPLGKSLTHLVFSQLFCLEKSNSLGELTYWIESPSDINILNWISFRSSTWLDIAQGHYNVREQAQIKTCVAVTKNVWFPFWVLQVPSDILSPAKQVGSREKLPTHTPRPSDQLNIHPPMMAS